MSDWKPISTEPGDGSFRLYGLHVTNSRGFRWFEVHYLSLDRDDTLDLYEPSGDTFSTWSFDDFEVWADAPAPPAETSEDKR